MHPEIERAIMGHSERGKSVHEGYGFISDEELIRAIDRDDFRPRGDANPRGGAKRKKPTRSGSSKSAERCEQNVSTGLSGKTAHKITC